MLLKHYKRMTSKYQWLHGTSIGSIVATLFAMGYDTNEMIELFKYFSKGLLKTAPKYLMSNIRSTKSIFGSGIISGQAIEDAVQECAKLKELKNIKDIKIPIAIPTVDLKTGKEIVFTNRKLNKNEEHNYIDDIEIGKAVRASCSYPGVFSPFNYNEYRFVDGGILDNAPAEETGKLGADKVITIKFPPKEIENPQTAINILFRCVDLIFDDRDTKKSENSNYILNLHVASSSTFDIKKIDACYEIGYQTTMQEIEKIKKALEET